MAAKYPLGAGTQPVVAPTTVSATTSATISYLIVMSRSHSLTSDNSVRPQRNELVFEFLTKPFNVFRLGLVLSLEAFRVGRSDVMEVLFIQNGLVRKPASGMIG